MEKFKTEFINFFKKLSHVATYLAILVIGLIIGYYYCTFQVQRVKQESPIVDVKSLSETSVGFTERHELMLIDRNTGQYVVYEDSIAIAIFTVLANQKYGEVIK